MSAHNQSASPFFIMKTLLTKRLVGIAVAGLLMCPAAFAERPTLLGFKGKYSGTVAFTDAGGTTPGTAAVVIKVPRNGKSATVSYAATFVSSMGDVSVLPADFVLAKNKTMTVTDLGVGIAGTNNAHPGSGTWSQRRRSFTFFATNGDMTLNGTATVRDTRKKRKLALTLVSADGGGTYTFANALRSKLPKR
jgi:hypothetical protein